MSKLTRLRRLTSSAMAWAAWVSAVRSEQPHSAIRCAMQRSSMRLYSRRVAAAVVQLQAHELIRLVRI